MFTLCIINSIFFFAVIPVDKINMRSISKLDSDEHKKKPR